MKINKNKENLKTVKPKRNLIVVVILSILIVALSGGIYYGLSQLLQTESYYVLNQNVKPKMRITADMLDEVVTAKDTAPKNAATKTMVEQGAVYSKYALSKGDIVTPSNAGIDLDIGTGVPEEWSYTSFTINSEDALGGKIGKGDYFDILAVSDDEGAKYIVFNVLALDVNLETVESVSGKNIQVGTVLHYIVGMPADKIAEFQYAVSKYGTIKLIKSPNIVRYKKRDISQLGKTFLVDSDTKPIDLYEGTDPTFATVLRDNNTRPVNKENCLKGIIEPMSLCEKIDVSQPTTETPEQTTSTPENTQETSESTEETTENTEETTEISTEGQ